MAIYTLGMTGPNMRKSREFTRDFFNFNFAYSVYEWQSFVNYLLLTEIINNVSYLDLLCNIYHANTVSEFFILLFVTGHIFLNLLFCSWNKNFKSFVLINNHAKSVTSQKPGAPTC
jgi:hypothetical protein